MAISVCGLNIRLVMESVTRKGRGACMSLRNSMTFFYGRGRMGAKGRSKATPEQRERHRQGCRAAAASRLKRQRWIEAHEGVLEKCDLLRDQGIDVEAILKEAIAERGAAERELIRNTRRVFDTIHKLRDRGVDVEAAMNDFYRREGII